MQLQKELPNIEVLMPLISTRLYSRLWRMQQRKLMTFVNKVAYGGPEYEDDDTPDAIDI